ncbi:MAG: pyrrolo-quinoline quinone [Ruminococcaceae bacterium]|nr:pyrrolo-quinoline quinone [Oscillospiraceae bacterium]
MKKFKIRLVMCCVALLLVGCTMFLVCCGKNPLGTNSSSEMASVNSSGEPVTPPQPKPTYTMSATSVDSTHPDKWVKRWQIIANGEMVDSFNRSESISFGSPEDYFKLEGIATFRGNNYRSDATYGVGNVQNKTLTKVWEKSVGYMNGWGGSGWTGQPLLVRWDKETKSIMNMYDSAKQKDGLVEVIYATLDGNIYFYDLDTGARTRNPLDIGMNFKGAGAIDPRGYPILYVGSGIAIDGKQPRMYAISLIDGSILYERSGKDSYAQRAWYAFDSSPLVDAETDTLIWPGESGILYTIKLNTQYDKSAGTLTMNPKETAKIRYKTVNTDKGYRVGFEASCVIVDRYLYISDNGGMFFCIDLDTMEVVWAQDTKDDSNSTPVFEWDDNGNGYIYTAPSLRKTASEGEGKGSGEICIYKLNAKTGEIVWKVPYTVKTYPDISGGVQSSPLLGRKGTDLEGLIIYTIARCPNMSDGKMVAFDTKTGAVVWEYTMKNYTWSSPVAVYNADGTAYVVSCDSAGNVRLHDSKTGAELSKVNVGSNCEASPVIFEDRMIIGTRASGIHGIKIS